MNLSEIEKVINSLIDTFVKCGDVSLQLRNKGLKKTIKDDNTPVTNGDIMVNNLLIEKITYLPDSFMVNDTKNKISTKVFTREEAGLPNDGFIFCCFNINLRTCFISTCRITYHGCKITY